MNAADAGEEAVDVLVENVPGLLSSNGGRDFAVVLATLAELGFHDLAWRILDSRYFGVPQRRRRVFVLARRAQGRSACEVLLEPESGGGDFAPRGEARQAAPVASFSGLGTGGPDDNDGQAGRIVTALTTRGGNTQDDQRISPEDTFVTAFDWTQDDHAPEGRDYSPPIRKAGLVASPPAVFISETVRRLTPCECERLQGFPDDWTLLDESTPDSRRYAALGDAVTVPVAHWIGLRLRAAVVAMLDLDPARVES